MIPRKNGLFAGIFLSIICVAVFWVARFGVFQTETCYMCGAVVQDYVQVAASPKSANILNSAMLKDETARKNASVTYTFCNDCFEELQGAIVWHRQQKVKGE